MEWILLISFVLGNTDGTPEQSPAACLYNWQYEPHSRGKAMNELSTSEHERFVHLWVMQIKGFTCTPCLWTSSLYKRSNGWRGRSEKSLYDKCLSLHVSLCFRVCLLCTFQAGLARTKLGSQPPLAWPPTWSCHEAKPRHLQASRAINAHCIQSAVPHSPPVSLWVWQWGSLLLCVPTSF